MTTIHPPHAATRANDYEPPVGFYDAPDLVKYGESGPILWSPDVAVTLGSDLVLSLWLDTEGEQPAWTFMAHDNDGNHLATLATVGTKRGNLDAAMRLLPTVAGTARALFPSHLLTER